MVEEPLYKSIGVVKRSGIETIDSIRLPHDEMIDILLFSLSLPHVVGNKTKKRGYIIELHRYDGFGMVKFYPRVLKNNPKKYELRSHELGYTISFGMVRQILWQCAHIMKAFLDENPNQFVGYVGQPDKYDDREENQRLKSQRSTIYDVYVSSLFRIPKYSLSSEDLFGPFNLKLIRKATKHQEFKLTPQQKLNYSKFLNFLKKNESQIPNLMTKRTRMELFIE